MIPCYITVHNLHTWTVEMVKDCRRLGLEPIICDHGSTFQPLIDWYATHPCEIRRFGNDGPHGFFNRREYLKRPGPYVHTDCDLDLSTVPEDAIQMMLRAWDHNPWATKVGLSLEIEDITESFLLAQDAIRWETGYWKEQTEDGHWKAGVDGTFALYDPSRADLLDPKTNFYTAVRMNRPYTARHLPWYLTAEEVQSSEEFREYFGKVGRVGHWSARIGAASGVRPPLED